MLTCHEDFLVKHYSHSAALNVICPGFRNWRFDAASWSLKTAKYSRGQEDRWVFCFLINYQKKDHFCCLLPFFTNLASAIRDGRLQPHPTTSQNIWGERNGDFMVIFNRGQGSQFLPKIQRKIEVYLWCKDAILWY